MKTAQVYTKQEEKRHNYSVSSNIRGFEAAKHRCSNFSFNLSTNSSTKGMPLCSQTSIVGVRQCKFKHILKSTLF